MPEWQNAFAYPKPVERMPAKYYEKGSILSCELQRNTMLNNNSSAERTKDNLLVHDSHYQNLTKANFVFKYKDEIGSSWSRKKGGNRNKY